MSVRKTGEQKKGILGHLYSTGTKLYETRNADYLDDEEKKELYKDLLLILEKDREIINGHKKLYEGKLPPGVARMIVPVDNNMLKVMDCSILVIDNYLKAIDNQDDDCEELFAESFAMLDDMYSVIYDSRDMMDKIEDDISLENSSGDIGVA